MQACAVCDERNELTLPLTLNGLFKYSVVSFFKFYCGSFLFSWVQAISLRSNKPGCDFTLVFSHSMTMKARLGNSQHQEAWRTELRSNSTDVLDFVPCQFWNTEQFQSIQRSQLVVMVQHEYFVSTSFKKLFHALSASSVGTFVVHHTRISPALQVDHSTYITVLIKVYKKNKRFKLID
jgi:hypothetical protein